MGYLSSICLRLNAPLQIFQQARLLLHLSLRIAQEACDEKKKEVRKIGGRYGYSFLHLSSRVPASNASADFLFHQTEDHSRLFEIKRSCISI